MSKSRGGPNQDFVTAFYGLLKAITEVIWNKKKIGIKSLEVFLLSGLELPTSTQAIG